MLNLNRPTLIELIQTRDHYSLHGCSEAPTQQDLEVDELLQELLTGQCVKDRQTDTDAADDNTPLNVWLRGNNC